MSWQQLTPNHSNQSTNHVCKENTCRKWNWKRTQNNCKGVTQHSLFNKVWKEHMQIIQPIGLSVPLCHPNASFLADSWCQGRGSFPNAHYHILRHVNLRNDIKWRFYQLYLEGLVKICYCLNPRRTAGCFVSLWAAGVMMPKKFNTLLDILFWWFRVHLEYNPVQMDKVFLFEWKWLIYLTRYCQTLIYLNISTDSVQWLNILL